MFQALLILAPLMIMAVGSLELRSWGYIYTFIPKSTADKTSEEQFFQNILNIQIKSHKLRLQ